MYLKQVNGFYLFSSSVSVEIEDKCDFSYI